MKRTMILDAVVLMLMGAAISHVGNSPKAGEAGETTMGKADGNKEYPEKIKLPETSNVLVVLYSRSGNTRAVADFIKKELDAVSFEIQTVNPYPAEYRPTTEQAKTELETGYHPPIKAVIDNIDHFDTIFIGSPCWWSTVAPPVMTFLAGHDLEGKTVVPFITHEGSGLGRAPADVKRLCPKSTLKDGLAVRGGRAKDSEKTVKDWLARIGVKK